jgi:NTE family protein
MRWPTSRFLGVGEKKGGAVRTAFVLPGGASLGAVQVGALRALFEAGITPDLVVGASVGALNGAMVAALPNLEGVERLWSIWESLRRRDVLPLNPVLVALGIAGLSDHCVSGRRLARWLEERLPLVAFEDAAVPLVVTATDLEAGVSVELSAGPILPALLASSAIPGLLPPVRIGRRVLVDGSVLNDVPVDVATAWGAERIIVVETTGVDRRQPRRAGSVISRCVDLLSVNAGRLQLARVDDARVETLVIPLPPVALGQNPLDFGSVPVLLESSLAHARAVVASWKLAERTGG